jgi:hypothetical protein
VLAEHTPNVGIKLNRIGFVPVITQGDVPPWIALSAGTLSDRG